MNKKSIGELNRLIYFEENLELSSTKDDNGGYIDSWVPALGEISDVAESTTTTTSIKMTAHGMETGDYIINVTRSNAIRSITKTNDNVVAVSSVTSQAVSDIIKKRMYNYSKAWAYIESKSNSYNMENQQKSPYVTHSIQIRNREDIVTKFRIKYKTQYFEIVSMYELPNDNTRLILDCRELIL